MSAGLIKSLSIYQRVKLIAISLAGMLVLLLVIGAVWAITLPPAPVVLPSPEALQAASVVLSNGDAESHYLDGWGDKKNEAQAVLHLEADRLGGQSVMAERPLFWATRRPVSVEEGAPTVAATTAPPSDLDRMELTGVYFAGDASGVIVRMSGERLRVPLGQEVMGWKLERVTATEVHFSSGGQQRAIQLEHARMSDYTPSASQKASSSMKNTSPNRAQQP